VAYTRKSLIMDAVDSLVAGVDGVFLKPNAAGDSAIRAATRDQAPRLIEAWAHVVDARFHHQKNALAARLVGAGRMDAARTLLTAAEPALLADLDLGDRLFLETLDDWTRAKASKFQ
jgi:Flp pilus assembly CpaF family ATPase